MKYDFDLEDHSKKRKEIFLRVLLCALEIGVVIISYPFSIYKQYACSALIACLLIKHL